jgi:hypothetical protein
MVGLHPIENQSVACAREVLCDILQFFTPAVLDASAKNVHMRLAEVASFIAFALPFGEPASTTRLASVRSMVKQGFVDDVTNSTATATSAVERATSYRSVDRSVGWSCRSSPLPSSAAARLPAWKPFLYRIGKKRLEFVVAEAGRFGAAWRGRALRDARRRCVVLSRRARWCARSHAAFARREGVELTAVCVPPTHTLATHICVSSAQLTPADASRRVHGRRA